jgi:hypothetical protein
MSQPPSSSSSSSSSNPPSMEQQTAGAFMGMLQQMQQQLAQQHQQQAEVNQQLFNQIQQIGHAVAPVAHPQPAVDQNNAVNNNHAAVNVLSRQLIELSKIGNNIKAFENRSEQRVEHFIEELDRLFALLPIDERVKISFVTTLLKGEVGRWYDQYITTQLNCIAPQAWNTLKTALIEQFRKVGDEVSARFELDRLHQNARTVASFNEQYRSIMARIPSFQRRDAVLEQDRIHFYLRRINQRLVDLILKRDPTTLYDAMKYAQDAENYMNRVQAVTTNSRGGYNNNTGNRNQVRTNTPWHASGSATSQGAVPMELGYTEQQDQGPPGGNATDEGENQDEQNQHGQAMNVNAINQNRPFNNQRPYNPSRPSNSSTRLTPEQLQAFRTEGRCFYCKEKGHVKRDCPKLNNKPKNL